MALEKARPMMRGGADLQKKDKYDTKKVKPNQMKVKKGLKSLTKLSAKVKGKPKMKVISK